MAFSRHLDAYPFFLMQIAEKVVIDGVEVSMECASPIEAKRLRHKLYGLRFAYLHEDNKGHPMHTKASNLFAYTEGNLFKVCPATQQPDERRFAEQAALAIAEAKPPVGGTNG